MAAAPTVVTFTSKWNLCFCLNSDLLYTDVHWFTRLIRRVESYGSRRCVQQWLWHYTKIGLLFGRNSSFLEYKLWRLKVSLHWDKWTPKRIVSAVQAQPLPQPFVRCWVALPSSLVLCGWAGKANQVPCATSGLGHLLLLGRSAVYEQAVLKLATRPSLTRLLVHRRQLRPAQSSLAYTDRSSNYR